ncbi:MAG TPA: helicase, partial [Afifellaceae bacterium]|nr:helicase [Afifellaceae bacterium]
LADEHLTGPLLHAVEVRLTQWLQTRIGTVLAPLTGMAADESLTGLARGLAFRLMENLGILDRRDVLEDVRALDQEARAGLRKHGVRFGAYHIYVPALLKPGASALLAQLWALKHAELDLPGLTELPAISASGRTSIDVDPDFSANVYRRFGYRVYGRRAVRIDILERLADLIRPALSWNPAITGDRPDGAIDNGRGFIVTPAMTSLLGASGDDMAVILRGLGYHCENRPASELTTERKSEPKAESSDGHDMPSSPAVDGANAKPDGIEPVAIEAVQRGDAAAEMQAQEQAETPAETEVAVAPGPDLVANGVETVEDSAPAAPVESEQLPGMSSVQVPSAETRSSAAPESVPADEHPAMVEIWRIGGQRRQTGRGKRQDQRAGGRTARTKSPPGPDRSKAGTRSKRSKPGGQQKGDKSGKPRPVVKPPRERPVDPDNPFAALATLKKDLEKTGDR